MIKYFDLCDVTFKIVNYALKGMFYEISAYPKPGLVTPNSTGAHKDMDFYTFVDSICSLQKYIMIFTQIGYSEKDARKIFDDARILGINAEKCMYNNTNDINTQKGLIFLMGISCIAVSKTIYDGKKFSNIRNVIKYMTNGIVQKELEGHNYLGNKDVTYGEKFYRKYGIQGIRGEVEKGIPIVFDYALKFYKENCDLSLNDRLVNTLIAIMQYCEDTNILHHNEDINTLRYVQKKASEIIKIGGMRTKRGKEAIIELDYEFSKYKISPGGSADLLAVTVFYYFVDKYFSTIKNVDKYFNSINE